MTFNVVEGIAPLRGRPAHVARHQRAPDRRHCLIVAYFHEKRSGGRTNNGTSFGFGNVIETVDPANYVTQDFGVTGSLKGSWGTAFVGFNYNDFTDIVSRNSC